MQIKFTSSLTAEDENSVAQPLLKALADILDALPIAYALRIETIDARVYRYSRPTQPSAKAETEPPALEGFATRND